MYTAMRHKTFVQLHIFQYTYVLYNLSGMEEFTLFENRILQDGPDSRH